MYFIASWKKTAGIPKCLYKCTDVICLFLRLCYTGQLFLLKAFLFLLVFFFFFVINSNMTKYAKIQIKTILCLIICLHCLKLSFGVLIYIAL